MRNQSYWLIASSLARVRPLALGFVIGREPGEPFVESVARRRAGRLNVPVPISDPGQTQLLLDLVRLHGIRQVLLVGEDQDDCVAHLAVVNNAMQLLSSLVDPVAIRTVHYEDQALGAGVIVPPKWTYLILPAHVPDVKLDVLVRNGLYVESHCRDGGDRLSQFEFVKDCRLSRRVKSKHQYSHLLVAKDLRKYLPHLVGCAYIRFIAGTVWFCSDNHSEKHLNFVGLAKLIQYCKQPSKIRKKSSYNHMCLYL